MPKRNTRTARTRRFVHAFFRWYTELCDGDRRSSGVGTVAQKFELTFALIPKPIGFFHSPKFVHTYIAIFFGRITYFFRIKCFRKDQLRLRTKSLIRYCHVGGIERLRILVTNHGTLPSCRGQHNNSQTRMHTYARKEQKRR